MGDEFTGPPQKTIFDSMTPEQRAAADKYLNILDGIKLYKAAGGMGVGAQWAPYAADLERSGGITEEQALNLARYRMWKQGMPVPTGPREPDLTPEQKGQRANAFVAGTPEQRAKMLEEDQRAIWQSHQGYFDGLVKKQEKPKPAENREPTS